MVVTEEELMTLDNISTVIFQDQWISSRICWYAHKHATLASTKKIARSKINFYQMMYKSFNTYWMIQVLTGCVNRIGGYLWLFTICHHYNMITELRFDRRICKGYRAIWFGYLEKGWHRWNAVNRLVMERFFQGNGILLA